MGHLRLKFLAQLKAYPTMMWLLSIGTVINLTGMSFLWPLNTIYIHQFLGKSLAVAGLVLLVQQAAAMIGNLAGGVMFDKLGGRKTVITGISVACLTVFSLGWVQSFSVYTMLMGLLGFCFGMIMPTMNALAGSIWREGGRKAINMIYVSQNLGVALGSAIGGFVAHYSFKWVFFGNALTYIAFLSIFISVFKEHRMKPSMNISGKSNLLDAKPLDAELPSSLIQSSTVSKWLPLGLLSFGFIISWIAYVQWQTSIAVHLTALGFSLAAYSSLWTINGAMIVLGQPLTAWFIAKFARRLKSQIIYGVLIYALALFIVSQATSYYSFVIAMMITTFGEMLAWPGVPALAAEMAEKGREGRYQGIISSAATAGRMIGPLFGGLLFERFAASWVFLLMMGFCLAASIFFYSFDRFNPSKTGKPSDPNGTLGTLSST